MDAFKVFFSKIRAAFFFGGGGGEAGFPLPPSCAPEQNARLSGVNLNNYNSGQLYKIFYFTWLFL